MKYLHSLSKWPGNEPRTIDPGAFTCCHYAICDCQTRMGDGIVVAEIVHTYKSEEIKMRPLLLY